METLHGVCTIVLICFTDEGDLDEASIESLSEAYLRAGVHGVVVLGITGEAQKLSDAERVVVERYSASRRWTHRRCGSWRS